MQRTTRQRQAIIECLTKKGRPLSVEEILQHVKQEIDTINLSTVYRNLKILFEEGRLSKVIIPTEKICYELVEKEEDHHHHFLCERCKKTFKIHACPNGLINMIPEGFHLKNHTIHLKGYCNTCA